MSLTCWANRSKWKDTPSLSPTRGFAFLSRQGSPGILAATPFTACFADRVASRALKFCSDFYQCAAAYRTGWLALGALFRVLVLGHGSLVWRKMVDGKGRNGVPEKGATCQAPFIVPGVQADIDPGPQTWSGLCYHASLFSLPRRPSLFGSASNRLII